MNNASSPQNNQSKSTRHLNQIQTIFRFLETVVATASMVSKETGVPQKNICRYKRDLEKAGLLAEVKKDYCAVTRFKAWYLTTNKDMFPARSKQMTLF